MNILMIVDDLNVGGSATHVLSISKQLLKRGYKVIIISKVGTIENRFLKESIKVLYLDLDKDLDEISQDIISIINQNNIDIIHTHLIRSIEIANKIKSITKIDFISTLHVLSYDKRIFNLLNNAKHIICVSDPIKDALIKNCDYNLENKVSVIYNGVNISYKDINLNFNHDLVSKLYKSKDNFNIITYCSRLTSIKGIICEDFLKKFYEIAKEDDTLIAIILGDGNRKRNVEFYSNYINDCLNRKAVYVVGNVDYPEEFFNISDCVVGTGRVIIEAINSNTACIAYGSSGFVGVVEKGNYSKLIKTYFGEHKSIDFIEKGLIESMNFLLYNKEIKSIVEENKKWCIKEFNEDVNILKLTQIYLHPQELLENLFLHN